MDKELSTWIAGLLARGDDERVPLAQVKVRFDKEDTAAYGVEIAKWFPDYEFVHGLLCDVVRPYLPSNALILDLGGGTGRIAKLLLDELASCRIVVQDISANMLSEVPNKLSEYAGRFKCVQGDFFSEQFELEPNRFDCIVSVHAIHHGRGTRVYHSLYRRIFRWLKSGGCFVCLDNVAGDTPELAALSYAAWAETLKSNYNAEEIRSIVETTIREDSPISLREHLEILRDCGFDRADVVWKKHIFGLYAGFKISSVRPVSSNSINE